MSVCCRLQCSSATLMLAERQRSRQRAGRLDVLGERWECGSDALAQEQAAKPADLRRRWSCMRSHKTVTHLRSFCLPLPSLPSSSPVMITVVIVAEYSFLFLLPAVFSLLSPACTSLPHISTIAKPAFCIVIVHLTWMLRAGNRSHDEAALFPPFLPFVCMLLRERADAGY